MAPFMANAISLDSLERQANNKYGQLTTLQFEEYLSTLKGTKVDWSGKVLNVKRLTSKGSYYIELDYTPYHITQGYLFKVLDKATALTLEKNQEYNFSGEISTCFKDALMFGYACYINITGFK
jgi:hypothetical protein